MNVTIDELNECYSKVKQIKYDLLEEDMMLPEILEVGLDRNPLTDDNFYSEENEFITISKLKFRKSLHNNKDIYILDTIVNVIDENDDN